MGTSPQRPFLSVDVSSGDQVLCGGTELVGEDSLILFWDVRQGGSSSSSSPPPLLGGYWDSHSEDVTCVRFHPSKVHALASGATDGLVNLFDLLQPKEEDALLLSLNTDSSVVITKNTKHQLLPN